MESPRFPDKIAVGVSMGPEFVTVIGADVSGYEVRNKARSRALIVGDCSHIAKTPAQYKELLTFFRSVGGRWTGFRIKDFSDFTLLTTESLLVPITGTVNQFQITKLYQSAVGYSEQRPLRKIVSGTLSMYDNGVLMTVGAGAGNYTVDMNTGIITTVAKQTDASIGHVVGATHQFTTVGFSPMPSVGQHVSVSGVTGTAATLLNGLRLTVSATGTGTVNVSVNTTGLTASGGTLSYHPPVATMTAACEFDVPCRFDTDSMPATIEHHEVYNWSSIPIKEIIE